MVTVEKATEIILAQTIDFGIEKVNLKNAVGRVLAEDLEADRDFPPFNSIRMDGIVINYAAFAKGKLSFKIEQTCGAGMPQATLENPDENCIEIMTGAVCPVGADTSIRYEDLKIEDGVATIQIEDIREKQNVQIKGMNRTKGEIICKKGAVISAGHIGVASTVGKPFLKVKKLPKVTVLSSGDELIPVAKQPLPHQIRRSNAHAISAQLFPFKLKPKLTHLPDNEKIIKEKLAELFLENEVLILSGGVSMGKFDYIPQAMIDLGVKQLFYKVKQRPGKPFWFGKHRETGTLVFAFPGNPVSTFVGVQMYFLPWLRKNLGIEEKPLPSAILAEDISFKPDLVRWCQVKIEFSPEGKILAYPQIGKGSSDHANLVKSDGWVRLPQGKELFKKGEVYPLIFR